MGPDPRIALIQEKISAVATFIKGKNIPDKYIARCARALFQRICLFAIFSKHNGFQEEEEWRLVYFKDRDKEERILPYLSYINGPTGIQPKLKLKAGPIEGVIDPEFCLEDIIHSVIIGPSASSPLTKMAVERMFKSIGKTSLIEKLKMSSIPFQSN
jgi:hypothetical protein